MTIFPKIFNSRSGKDEEFFLFVKKTIGFTPHKIDWYRIAFTHSSANESDKQGNPINYERMEFLGDAVLGTVIAAFLLQEAPFGNEGYLSQMRSKIVSRRHLNDLGKELELITFSQSNIPKNYQGDNIHGNLFEALIGAIYLDRGFAYCERFIQERIIDKHVDIKALENRVMSYKSLIIEWCQKEKKVFHFDVVEDTGKESMKYFSVKLIIDNKPISKARDTSKKKAEEKAAKRAFYALQNSIQQTSVKTSERS
ncbi:MAG: ribonuclease III [Bacteroidetes bacterium]|nr:ribonuclease III [Bacteroidota bacterium]